MSASLRGEFGVDLRSPAWILLVAAAAAGFALAWRAGDGDRSERR